MKYIKNTGRYAVAFVIVLNNREVKVDIDRRRLYVDTGRIATDGITPVDDKVLAELQKQDFFNKKVDSGEFQILEEEQVKTPDENKIKALEEKNRELEAKLAETENKDVAKVEAENKALADENASLKAKLEALSGNKSKKGKASPDKGSEETDTKAVDTEGF